MGECRSPERQHQVQWAASCVGAACARISFRYVLSKVTARAGEDAAHVSFTWRTVNYSRLDFLSVPQAQHISAGVHRPAGAHVPAQHPRHQAAVPPLCYRTIIQRGHWRRRTREQHPPHPLHHPHCALRPQHVRTCSDVSSVGGAQTTPPAFICFCPAGSLCFCELSRQYKGHIAGGEEPADFPGAAM